MPISMLKRFQLLCHHVRGADMVIRRELMALKELRHRNIVSFLGLGKESSGWDKQYPPTLQNKSPNLCTGKPGWL